MRAWLLVLWALLPGAALATTGQPAGQPARVVSINLCTDQLAMALAAPGQLVSVSELARDPRASVMAAEAAAWPTNRAQAEEVFALRPDLVLAGSYSDPATLILLERLGVPVERFPPAFALADVGAGIRHMGRALDRQAEAEAMAHDFEASLAALRSPNTTTADTTATRPLAAIWSANGYTTGSKTLTGEALDAAGYDNLAGQLGMAGGGVLALELLIMAAPDLLIRGDTYPGSSRAEEILDHPVLARLGATEAAMADRDWLCGLPQVLAPIRALRALQPAP